MVFSYIRISTQDQHTETQRLKIESFAKQRGFQIEEEIAVEISSRKSLEKRRINELVERLQEGDLLICVSLSRLARNTVEVITLVNELIDKGVRIIIIDESMDLQKHDYMSQMLVSLFGAFYQMERSILSERTKSGIARARAEGKQIGRLPYGSKYDPFEDRIMDLLERGYSIRSIALNHLPELNLKHCTSLRNWLNKKAISIRISA